MDINFRQGIVSAQNNFLSLLNDKVSINTDTYPIILNFSYGKHNYLFIESNSIASAWSLTGSNNYWLYWDININTAKRTFGYTTLSPQYGSSFPTSPNIDQHFFNLIQNKMYVWDGKKWNEKIRLFAGSVTSGNNLNFNSIGSSQVNLNTTCNAGYILFNEYNNPIKSIYSGTESYFMTTEDFIYTQSDIYNGYKISSKNIYGKAVESIPKYHCIAWKEYGNIGLASNLDTDNPCVGISIEDITKGDIKNFITKGFLVNEYGWNFSSISNTSLYVDSNGRITDQIPQKTSIQQIGYVIDQYKIFIDIKDLILIDNDL